MEFSQEKKCFNLASIAVLILYAYFSFVSVLFRSDSVVVALLLLSGAFSYALFYIGTITENYTIVSVVTAVLLNIIVIPISYISNKELFSSITIMYVFGMLYVVIAMVGTLMCIMLILTFVTALSSMVYLYNNYGVGQYNNGNLNSIFFINTLLTLVVVGNIAGFCVRKLMVIYEQEQIKATYIVKNSEFMSDSKDTFLSNMSHEIRTPMNAILGTSQLLLENDLDEDARDKVLNILNATNALLSSINDMLDITHIETGIITVEEEEYDFGEMLSDIINMISVRVMDRNIEFVVQTDANIPKLLYGDGKRIRQLFINLLNNAVKYTKEGSITLSVKRQDISEEEMMLVASIKDTGVGIKEVDKNKLFDEFKRLDISTTGLGNVEGTGLGLFICKEITKAMNGSIEFDSTYGEGTEFSFEVPQKLIKGTENIVTADERYKDYKVLLFEKSEKCDEAISNGLESLGIVVDSAFGTEMFRSMFMAGDYTHIILDRKNYETLQEFLSTRLKDTKLLIVTDINQTDASGIPGAILVRPVYAHNLNDYFSGKRHSQIRRINVRGNFIAPDATVMTVDDNLTNLQVVEKILSKYKMKVLTASGGREALLKLENEKVDMIFLDYMMPDMDGVDTLKNIRAMKEEWTDTVPIVALTANAVGGVREMLLSEGFDDYISKPIEISKLERSILKFLPEDYIKISDEK